MKKKHQETQNAALGHTEAAEREVAYDDGPSEDEFCYFMTHHERLAVAAIVAYLGDDEWEHYQFQPSKDHIYLNVATLETWLNSITNRIRVIRGNCR